MRLTYTSMMRAALMLAMLTTTAACGQTGALYLPDKSIETPVEIRGPESTAPAPQAEPDKKEEKKDEKATQPPGR